jgi:hypothetical protein
MVFCTEFDTYVHEACVKQAAKDKDDLEAQLIANEVLGEKKDDSVGYLPQKIAEIMRGRTVLTVCSDLMSLVRGQTDENLDDARAMKQVIDHYIERWLHSGEEYDLKVYEMLLVVQRTARRYIQKREQAK